MKFPHFTLALAAISLFCGAMDSQAATVPYSENFDDDALGTTAPSEPSPESGTFTQTGTWSVISGGISGQSYSNSISSNTQAYSLISFSGSLGGAVATAQNFTLASDFRFETGTANSVTLGLAFLTNSSVTSGYYVDMGSASDSIRLVKNGSTVITSTTTAVTGGVDLNVVYRLTISGLYVDTDANGSKDALDITATLFNGSTSVATFTYRDVAPSTDVNFGYRNRANSGGTLVGTMDNFTVALAIPEPSSVLLSLGALSGLLAVRRRR